MSEIALREHLERIIADLAMRIDERLEAEERLAMTRFAARDHAVALAQAAMEKRLEGMNEFRDTLRDQATRFVERAHMETLLAEIDRRLKLLETRNASLDGRVVIIGGLVTVALAVGLVVLRWMLP